ncbi:hypothetical protein [Falsiruegeria mediterranea]|uniref:Uncharacterized protein n=1 Tax=Falsiruegeria mediterranea M17 TaxID=1200281 RepID=A0A2R8CAE8_9RHOB|nr:hypothetical protein [Falsiruegeria mediterranea]SPJ29420.1 hypothetical protein TRM7615_02938 [Falsiruegeria mediterranea M17]
MTIQTAETLLSEQEILSWWSSERGRVDRECRAAAERFIKKACDQIEELTLKQVLLPSEQRKHIERGLQSDINMFNRRMERSLQDALSDSIEKIEGLEQFSSNSLRDNATLAAGGAVGFGAIAIAAAAPVIATTTTATTFLGFFATGTLVTFSWPVFAIVGVTAGAAALTSPTLVSKGRRGIQARFKAHIKKTVEQSLMSSGGKEPTGGTRTILFHELDRARDLRLERLITK